LKKDGLRSIPTFLMFLCKPWVKLATFRRKIQSGWPLGRIALWAENCKVERKRN
jgi:hypothetical protein